MVIVVTGAAGFIGRHLVPRLAERHEVVAVVRNPKSAPPINRVHVLAMDLTGPWDDGKLPREVDVIIHLAQANVSFPKGAGKLFAVNTASTERLLDYGRRTAAHQFILASSGDVYGYRLDPCRESDPPAPRSFYAVTKCSSEMLVQSYADFITPTVVRLFHPYGPGQTGRLVPNLVSRIAAGEMIRVNAEERPFLTPTYIDDVVTAFQRVVELEFRGIVNVAGFDVVSIRGLAERIGHELGHEPRFEETGLDAGNMIGNNERLVRELGLSTMVSLKDGLARVFRNGRR